MNETTIWLNCCICAGWRTLTTMMTDGSGLEKLLVACQNGDISQVRRLLKDPRIRRKDLIDINLNVENRYVLNKWWLLKSCRANNLYTLWLRLIFRPFQGTALTAAAGSGDSDVVKALLSLRHARPYGRSTQGGGVFGTTKTNEFSKTHNRGLHHLFLTVSWDLCTCSAQHVIFLNLFCPERLSLQGWGLLKSAVTAQKALQGS